MSTTSEGSWRFTGLGLKVHPKTTLAHPSTFQEECPKVPAETTLIHLTSHLLPASLEILPRRQDVALSCGAQCGRFVCAFVRFPEPLLTWIETRSISFVWRLVLFAPSNTGPPPFLSAALWSPRRYTRGDEAFGRRPRTSSWGASGASILARKVAYGSRAAG